MDIPLSESAQAVARLQKEGFYDAWLIKEQAPITFHVHPEATVSDVWMMKRVQAYRDNAKVLEVGTPHLDFYVYPSKEFAKDLGIIATFAIPSRSEVHGHYYQSKGHEVTHILLRQIIDLHRWPWSGLWPESICVLLDHERPDPKFRFLSAGYTKEIYQIPWAQWRQWLPDEYYPLAANIMSFLSERFGWATVKLFLKNLDASVPNDDVAAGTVFNFDVPALQREWNNWRMKLDVVR